MLQQKTLALDNDLDDMDAMMMNDNNDDLISDDEAMSEQLKASDKSPSWQAGVDPGANDNSLNIDTLANLNDTDIAARPCRNSVQVH